ncbi:hypothetical protein [Paenibacillus shenyangensis]|uniref:hypothetical protein n=1 Tax=Paenibacillus sp. A9 TaxID=1284352 RepID=UPI00036DDFCB|nr:hypothetical protein [Paenibacillus sp. A9]
MPLLETRRNIYTALEDLNFFWDEDKDLPQFQNMWNKGCSLLEIAEYFDRDPDEVVLLVIDQAREKKIKQRQHGLLGERESN